VAEKKVTPTIEEMVTDLIDGDKLKNFLDFNDFLKNNRFAKAKTAKNSCTWAVKHKNMNICSLRVRNDHWYITYFKGFTRKKWFDKCEKYITDELKQFILDNININTAPGICCGGVQNVTILGEKFANVCHCHPLWVNSPNGKALDYAKELVLIGKNIVTE